MDLALAVDLGGTKAEAALVGAEGALLPGSRSRAATGPTATRQEIADAITTVVTAALAAVPPSGRLIGAGIGSAGPVDIPAGRVAPLNLPAFRDSPIVDLVRPVVPGLPVVLALDGLCI